MPSSRALKLCPQAVFMPARFDAYRECSQHLHTIFKGYTNLIEPLSLDEAYLDVSDCSRHNGVATDIAMSIKQQVKQELNLVAAAGVSYNKFLAKIASDMDKPDGLYVIKPHQAEAFIEQLPVRKFFGVGKATEARMHAVGIQTGADLKRMSELQLQTHFGKSGHYYYNFARGIDGRPVRTSRQRKSIGKETTFSHDLLDKRKIWQVLTDIATRLDTLLGNKQLAARTVTLKVRYDNFKSITRSVTLDTACTSQYDIVQALPSLLAKTQVGKRPIRLIGITLSNLLSSEKTQQINDVERSNHQLGLF
jgi:DNA polymerase-4